MEISLNSKFYKKESIKRAILAFENEGVAKFKHEKEGGNHKIVVSNIDDSFKECLKEEFCNFALSEEIARE